LCGPGDSIGITTPPVTATTITYGGMKFAIIGYNKNGNEVGVAGPNNSVTLLLDNSEVYTFGLWNSSLNTFAGSTISTAMENFANSTINTNEGIISRTLTGGSSNATAGGYNEDHIKGSDVIDQKVWPLSTDEASHLILSTRIISGAWWLRTPGQASSFAADVFDNGLVHTYGDVASTNSFAIRPALYLDISSPVFSSLSFDINLPIGACAPQPNNFGIDYNAETITGLDNNIQGWSLADSYAGLTTPTQTTATPINISSNISNSASSLYYVKATTNADIYFNSNSDSNGVAKLNAVEGFSKLTIPARPSAPSGLTGVATSDVGASDGKITGTSNKMEYTQDPSLVTGLLGSGLLGASPGWMDITGGELTGLTSGTYFVRTVADQSAKKFKSFAKKVIVPEGSAVPGSGPSAGKPGSGTGPNAGDGGSSGGGTAQTGIDLAGLELLLLLLLLFVIPAGTCCAVLRCSEGSAGIQSQ
jgi:hypothetical protein